MFKWELRRIGVDLISSPQLHFPSSCSMFPDMQNLLVVVWGQGTADNIIAILRQDLLCGSRPGSPRHDARAGGHARHTWVRCINDGDLARVFSLIAKGMGNDERRVLTPTALRMYWYGRRMQPKLRLGSIKWMSCLTSDTGGGSR
jgi:hypothetical protein